MDISTTHFVPPQLEYQTEAQSFHSIILDGRYLWEGSHSQDFDFLKIAGDYSLKQSVRAKCSLRVILFFLFVRVSLVS